MTHNWDYKRLGDICKILNGYAFKSSNYISNGGLRIIRIANVQEGFVCDNAPQFYPLDTIPSLSKYILYEGDLLMSLTGNVGRVGILPKEFLPAALNQRVACLRLDKGLSKKFIFHFLNNKFFIQDAINFSTGVAQLNLSTEWLNNYLVPVPPMEVQERIVAELDKINEVIEDCRELLRNLDALAQSLFYDYFSSIDEYVPLSHYVNSLVGGKSLAGKEFCKNRVLKSGAITYDYFDKNSTKFLPLDYIPSPEHSVKIGDLIISRMNTAELVGACAYVFDVDENVYLPDRLWRIEYKSNANPIFLWKSLIAEPVKEQIRAKASGTSGTMKNISKSLLLSVKLKKVPLELQEKFAARIEEIEEQKKIVENTIAELQTLLDSRMDYWFN